MADPAVHDASSVNGFVEINPHTGADGKRG
jgi:hypothetical protein